MPKQNASMKNDELVDETMNVNNSCRDMTLVTDEQPLKENDAGAVNEEEYIDEP
ncbi:hypothetical protein [Paenibacillus beijingensis]|uniref:hypothetical protein n=1 Tax=Paenibacillus beijingensis TaxID=1126833 RepID=UPI000B305281|nr:hypothetical protein [Paenibacillus beijingensis]